MADTPADLRALAQRVLADRGRDSLLRVRRTIEPIDATHAIVDGQRVVNFSSNDYLGLSHHPAILRAVSDAANIGAGAGAAALVTGRSPSHERAERALAEWKGVDDAVLLPSGFQANLAAIGAVAGVAEAAGRRVRFIADKLVHASLLDAIAATSAELRIVPHNGLAKLERLVSDRPADGLDVFVTESTFSMDGDRAALAEILNLRARYGFAVVLDEAHSTGLDGPTGAGLASALGRSGEIDLGIATFSKALGLVGGAVYGSTMMVEAVVNFGRAYVYTTSPPPFIAEGIVAAIDIARADVERRERLQRNVIRLRTGLAHANVQAMDGDSPIIPIVLGNEAAALEASQVLRRAGYLVIAVRPPTVARGTSRLRLTVSSEHTHEEIDGVIRAIAAL